MKKKLRAALIVLLALAFAVSGGYIAWKTLDYQRGQEDYQYAARAAGLPRRLPQARPDDGAPQVEIDPTAAALLEVDLAALRETNGEVIGWIVIPDTDLSYPVLQHADNRYYLNRTWSGERSAAGAIFLECQCAADFSDFNTIIYGHRMNNSQMFGMLRSYSDPDYLAAHPCVYLADDSGVRRYEVFAAYQARVRDMTYRLRLTGEEEKADFLAFALEGSVVDAGIEPTTDDPVLTLSTCVGTGRSSRRWVVQARLAEITPRGEP